MRPFSAGFSDEIEKLALRLPSMGQMQSSMGETEPSVTEPAASAGPAQNVHVHVHPAGGGGGKSKARPKPAAAPAPTPAAASKPDLPVDASLPGKPTGFGLKAPQKTFVGRNGQSFPSEMRREPRYEDVGTGPTKDTYFNGRALGTALGSTPHPLDVSSHEAPLSRPGKITNALETVSDSETNPAGDYAGIQKSKGRGLTPTPSTSQASQTKGPIIQPIPHVPASKPKMFGTALASNEPAKL